MCKIAYSYNTIQLCIGNKCVNLVFVYYSLKGYVKPYPLVSGGGTGLYSVGWILASV